MKKFDKCLYCDGSQIIKFGKTKTGVPRLKCNLCSKTWVSNKELIDRPSEVELVSKYFDGFSTRQLVPFFNSSPQKINKTIRLFLETLPNWEDYTNDIVKQKEHEIVYLVGQNFSCHCNHEECNNNFLALAIDSVSSFVLSYEVSISNKSDVWEKLITKMSNKGIKVNNFVSKIDESIERSLQENYPNSKRFTNLLKASRQKEICLCLKKDPIKHRLISDAIRTFYEFDNKVLEKTINEFDSSFEGYMTSFSNEFIKEIEKRCDLTLNSSDTLLIDFKDRFEKFHMIKCEPDPLINGWISYNMVKKLHCGFNRLDYYLREITNINFEKFSNNEKFNKKSISEEKLKKFVYELGTRFVNVPNVSSKCDKKNIFSR